MGSVGHYLLIAAHRLAPAAVLSPFIYTEIVLVIVLGYLVFGDLPNRWTLTGAAIVIASGLYIFQPRAGKVGEPGSARESKAAVAAVVPLPIIGFEITEADSRIRVASACREGYFPLRPVPAAHSTARSR